MSIYAYLVCEDCAQFLFLGKALRTDADVIFDFWNGGPVGHSAEERAVVQWNEARRMLAAHVNHSLRVLREEAFGPMLDASDPWREFESGGPALGAASPASEPADG
jgi:hypothetical protein